ncbi:MAG TPA: sugar ABC transporter substrate-binding protein [Candidatus Dormibacteraeota bacterium]
MTQKPSILGSELQSPISRRRFLLWSGLALGTLSAADILAACGGTSTTPPGSYKIAIVFYTKSIPYYQDMLNGFQDTEKKLGDVVLDVTYANFSVTDELKLVENAITRQPKALIVAPMDREALIPVIRKAKAAGIPVITVGDDLGEDGRDAELAYIGQSYQQLGQVKAQYLVDKLGGKGQVLVVHGPRGLDYVEAQKAGYQQVFAANPGIQVIEGPYGNFSSDVGLKSTEDLLTIHPNPNAIFFDNDDLALGGVQGIKERHITKSTLLMISSDGAKAAVDAVKAGDLDLVVSIRPYTTGVTALNTIHDYLTKGTVPHNPTVVEMLQITKDNVNNLKQLDYA